MQWEDAAGGMMQGWINRGKAKRGVFYSWSLRLVFAKIATFLCVSKSKYAGNQWLNGFFLIFAKINQDFIGMRALFILLFSGMLPFVALAQEDTQIVNLQTDHLESPLGIDNPRPRLSWQMKTERTGAAQTAYRICVGTDSAKVAAAQPDVWDSGHCGEPKTLVRYAGRRLQPCTTYYWMVQVTDEVGGYFLFSRFPL